MQLVERYQAACYLVLFENDNSCFRNIQLYVYVSMSFITSLLVPRMYYKIENDTSLVHYESPGLCSLGQKGQYTVFYVVQVTV